MTKSERPKPLKEAGRITKMLDLVKGEDRFDHKPVDVIELAYEYSTQTSPESPIKTIVEDELDGFMGALVYGKSQPRKWGILYCQNQSPGRKAYTIAHEFGHYVLHRKLIENDDRFEDGIYCDESSVLRREGNDIEQEADAFAANLLMPFHDFRRQISAKKVPSFEDLSSIADRYGVSLTAATLRWLEYTETRALLVISNEGFAKWAKTSKPALKTGHFIKTRNTMFELPQLAVAVKQDYRQETIDGISQPSGVWFNEPVVEMCIRSERYDQEMTLLHLPRVEPKFHANEVDEDTFDRFTAPLNR